MPVKGHIPKAAEALQVSEKVFEQAHPRSNIS